MDGAVVASADLAAKSSTITLTCAASCGTARQLEVINQQHPFEPLQYLPTTLRLPFAEGIAMLHKAGHEDVRD